ncbi:hypothetical protein [Chroococcidiopsis sp.]|uniref:hypothetical protein n=1 Tax=Chroococcidiopsis sp. TaxID=3088168 RepID=UPI003F35BC36
MVWWKQVITEVIFILAAIAPLYNLVIQLIRVERAAALERAEMRIDIKNLVRRADDFDEWRSANSGLRLPRS